MMTNAIAMAKGTEYRQYVKAIVSLGCIDLILNTLFVVNACFYADVGLHWLKVINWRKVARVDTFMFVVAVRQRPMQVRLFFAQTWICPNLMRWLGLRSYTWKISAKAQWVTNVISLVGRFKVYHNSFHLWHKLFVGYPEKNVLVQNKTNVHVDPAHSPQKIMILFAFKWFDVHSLLHHFVTFFLLHGFPINVCLICVAFFPIIVCFLINNKWVTFIIMPNSEIFTQPYPGASC